MAHSLIGADRATHLKIVAVALVAATLVVAVGIAARLSDFEAATALLRNEPVLKPGAPSALTTREIPIIR